MGRPLVAGVVCLFMFACGGAPSAPERFEERVEAGAECEELFEIGNEPDPKDPDVDRMNNRLQEIGCSSSFDSRSTSEVDNTRSIAEMLCEDSGAKKTAKTFGVSDSGNLEAIARGYSMDSTDGPHRDAAYEGCLQGLRNAEQ